jgi:hypothetical protein
MPFSQQSYAGQGIVQMDPRAGEFIGASLANMGASIGQSIGQGLQQRGQRNEEAKRKAGASKGMREAMVNLGLLEKDQANSMGFDELLSFSQNAPSLLAKQKEEQFGEVLSSYQQAKQPQSVSEQVDFGPQIERAESELGQAIQRNRFIPEIAYQTQAEQPVQPDVNQFYGQAGPGVADRLAELPAGIAKSLQQRDTPNVSIGLFPGQAAAPSPRTQRSDVSQMRDEMRAMRQSQSSRPAQASTPSPQSKPEQAKPSGPIGPEQMPPEPEEVTSLRDQLSSLQAKASEGATASRPETPEEAAKRLGDFWSNAFKKSPGAAVRLHEMLTKDTLEQSKLALEKAKLQAKPKLTESEQKSLGYAMRMQNAEELLDGIVQEFDPSGTFGGIANAMPNLMQSDKRQQYQTAAKDWITAVLRRESGAVIGKDEFERDFTKYFPQPNDTPGNVQLKKQLRQQALESILVPMGMEAPGQAKAAPRVTTRDKFGNIVTQ